MVESKFTKEHEALINLADDNCHENSYQEGSNTIKIKLKYSEVKVC